MFALDRTLDRFFASMALAASDTILVAFSGGGDSLALLLAAVRAAPGSRVEIVAAHVDHGLDSESARRASHAARLAAEVGARFVLARLDPAAIRRLPDGLEAAARTERYRALEKLRCQAGARLVLTAHHQDDQAETVLIRLASGSGWRGLAAIAPIRRTVARPLLHLPRRQLEATVEQAGLLPNNDPSNRDRRFARTLVRFELLPRLATGDPGIAERLARLADRARRARLRVDAQLAAHLDVVAELGAWSCNRAVLAALPAATLRAALDVLAARAGLPLAPGKGVCRELARQLSLSGPLGVDAGRGWRLEGDSQRARLVAPTDRLVPFVYDLTVPGRVHVGALGCVVQARCIAVESWMFRSYARRAALGSVAAGLAVGVRNRRSGDRFRPLGCAGSRRLKDVLIDRKIPRHLRDRLPLVTVDDQIAWVPGVGVGHRFRIRSGATSAWAIQILDAKTSDPRSRNRNL